MSESGNKSELMSLLEGLLNGELEAERFSRLTDLLRNDPAAQRTYLAYLDLHLGLKRLVGVEAGHETLNRISPSKAATRPLRRKISAKGLRTLAASLVVMMGVVFIVLLMMVSSKQPAFPAPKIAQVSGGVRIVGRDGQPRAAQVGMEISAGELLETQEPGSLAVLAYEDGTRLMLINESSLMCEMGERKSVVLHHGIISARVAPQPAGRPMLLTTPSAKIAVLGTRFALAATTDRTELNVTEGRVRLTRVSDGQSVEVAEGQGLITNGEARLAVRESDGPRAEWEADFEPGVPKGWTGTPATTDLPAGSKGAIQAIPEPNSEPIVYMIASREAWVEGLFAIHEDSHLHITMKMERPDWLNVFFSSRGADATHPTWALHIFNEVPFWKQKPGEWRTLTIPLTKFRRKRDGVFRDEPPKVGEVVYSLSISATEQDRGLVIDRIWTTRGGPGQVETKPIP